MQEVLESPRGKFEFKLTTTICIAGLVAACDSFSILAHFIGYGLELQILDQQHPYQIFLFSKHDTNRTIELPDNVAVLFELNRNSQKWSLVYPYMQHLARAMPTSTYWQIAK